MNHSLVWNQITRFTFAGTQSRTDEGQQSQYCLQNEKQKSLLKTKYTADKLYVVIDDIASTSTLDIGAAKGTLVVVIKKQDPMGDTARWYVDTGICQGFVPSQKLRAIQQNQQVDRTVKNIAVNAEKPNYTNLMSLDSPEKEIKQSSQSHLQDLLSLNLNQESKISHSHSNIPETPRFHEYQNVNNEVSILMFCIVRSVLIEISHDKI